MKPNTATTDERPDVILDLDRLTKNCNGNTAIMRELLAHLHQKSGPKWIAALQSGLASGNTEQLQEICHGMKGASATVFAWRISNLALELEHLAREGDVEGLRGRMGALEDAFDELVVWIQAHPELS